MPADGGTAGPPRRDLTQEEVREILAHLSLSILRLSNAVRDVVVAEMAGQAGPAAERMKHLQIAFERAGKVFDETDALMERVIQK